MSSEAWKKKLAELRYQSIHALQFEDFSFFVAFQASLFHQPITAIEETQAQPTIKDAEKKIRNETSQACTASRSVYEEFSNQIKKLKDEDKRDVSHWKEKLSTLKEETKAKSNKVIDGAFEEIEKYVDSLPSGLQGPAIDLFGSVWSKFMDFMKIVLKWLQEIVAAVEDFIRGIWNKVQEAWNAITSGFEIAIKAIKGALSSTGAPLVTVIVSTKELKYSEVTSELGKIFGFLEQNEIKISHHQIDDPVGIKYTVTITFQWEGDPGDGKSLDKIWAQALEKSSFKLESPPSRPFNEGFGQVTRIG